MLIEALAMGVFDPDRHENLIGITDLDELNEREALGLLKAQEYTLDLEIDFIFDSRLILDVHTIVFGELYDWAGKWRTIETNIGIPVGKVPYAVIEYADQVNFLKENAESEKDIIHCLFYTHHRFTQIHPFNNGNGRTARLLTDLVANTFGYQNIQLYVKKSGEERDQYRSALKAADNYDDRPLKQMIEQKLARFPE